jgi:hypothetical protein
MARNIPLDKNVMLIRVIVCKVLFMIFPFFRLQYGEFMSNRKKLITGYPLLIGM